MVRSAYENLDDERDIKLLYRDVFLDKMIRMFTTGQSDLNRIDLSNHAPESAIPDTYGEYFEGGTPAYEKEDAGGGAEPHRDWFDSNQPASKKGTLATAKAVEEDIGKHNWFDVAEATDVVSGYEHESVRKYLNSLGKSDMFTKEKEDGENIYKMTTTWRRQQQ